MKHTTNMVLIVAIAGAGACADLDESEMQLETGIGGGGTGTGGGRDIETQGRYLLGETIDGILPADDGRMFSVGVTGSLGSSGPGAAVTLTFTGDASMSSAGASGPVFTGTARMKPHKTGAAGELLVEFSRVVSTSSTTIAYYHLSWHDTPTAAWEPLCGGADAVPYYYDFTTTGLHAHPATGQPTDRISFSCLDGVGAKCAGWEYFAGDDYSSSSASPWQTNQACLKEASANYCATGVSHTRVGTAIELFDEVGIKAPPPDVFLGVASWPPPVADFYFEAGWRGDDLPVVCLSKLRWDQYPIGEGPCGDDLPDPRVDVDAKTCDELIGYDGQIGPPGSGDGHAGQQALADFAAAYDVVVFNGSRYNQLGMHAWKSGNDRVTTVDGYYDDNLMKKPYASTYAPLPVALDSLLMRAIPTSVDPSWVERIGLYSNGAGDRVYLPDSAAAGVVGYTLVAYKGFVYTPSGKNNIVGAVPMTLYKKTSNGDYTTTSSATLATTLLNNGYVSQGVIGYTDPVEPAE